MKAVLSIILIAGALVLGYMGYTKVQPQSASVKALDMELRPDNTSRKKEGYMLVGVAILLFAGGVITSNKSKNASEQA